MPKNDIFFNSSALIAGIVSTQGAARAILLLAEDEKVQIIVSEQVITEVEHSIARKVPKALLYTRELILAANIRIVRDPQLEEVLLHQDRISHAADVSILVAAARSRVDFLATMNTKHFLEDPQVAYQSGLRIGTPGDALAWVREQLSKTVE